MFIDSHAHLEGPRYEKDRGEVLFRAQEAGVDTVLAIGNGRGPDDVDCGIRLAERHNSGIRMFASIGIHPHEARLARDEHFARMQELAHHPKVVAWGEIGLDYWYEHSPHQVQKDVFVRQMQLARAARLPIVIHCRPSQNSHDGWDDCFALITELWVSSGLGGVMHCFTGTVEDARRSLDLGFMISFAGNVTFPKAENIREAAKFVPLDRMLIETDSPYLAPVPHRGQRNEPAYVAEVARQIAELRGLSLANVGEKTSENFHIFFRTQSPRASGAHKVD